MCNTSIDKTILFYTSDSAVVQYLDKIDFMTTRNGKYLKNKMFLSVQY